MQKLLYKLAGWLKRHCRHIVIKGQDGTPYLTRIYLIGSSTSYGGLCLHWMHRPDADQCQHDHPWDFFTLILAGGYEEEVSRLPGLYDAASVVIEQLRPGALRYRPATYTHRIRRLLTGEALTLVLRSPKRRSWGFWTTTQQGRNWVGWKPFLEAQKSGVAWCADLIDGLRPPRA